MAYTWTALGPPGFLWTAQCEASEGLRSFQGKSQVEVSHGCYGQEMDEESLSQRELRNRSGEVLRRVAAGESFVLTNNGVPVGRLVPLDEPEPPVRFDRPATRVGGWEQFLGVVPEDVDLQATLQELREDRL